MRLPPPSMRCSSSPMRTDPGRAAELLEAPRVAHEVALLLVSRIRLASGRRAPFIHGGARRVEVDLGRGSAPARPGRGTGRRSAPRRELAATVPSIRIRQWTNGSTSSKDSEPAPRIRVCPSAPRGVVDRPGSTALNTRPSAQATLIWMSWVSHWSATASTPHAGKADGQLVVPDPRVHRLALLGVRRAGSPRRARTTRRSHRSGRCSSLPLRPLSWHARRVVGEPGADLVEVEPELGRRPGGRSRRGRRCCRATTAPCRPRTRRSPARRARRRAARTSPTGSRCMARKSMS